MVQTNYTYDPDRQGGTQWGNVTQVEQRVRSGGAWSAPVRTTYTWYYPNPTNSITNKPGRVELYKGCAGCSGGQIVSQRLLYYDQDTAGNHETPPTKGQLRFDKIGSGSVWLLTTQYQYWSNGNLRKVIDGLQHATETFYDTQFQAYAVCVKNALGHTAKTHYYGVPGSTESGCTTTAGTAAWNGSGVLTSGAFFGQVEDVADANNALTSFSYDSWGRPVGIWRPGEAQASGHAATEVFTYENSGPFKVKHSRRDDLGGANTATYLESTTFYDTFGRAVQTQSEAAGAGKIIVANIRYNGLDQVIWQSLPYEVVATLGAYQTPAWDSQPKTEASYDGLGRVFTVTNPDGSQRQMRYRFVLTNREIGVVDEMGHQEIQEIDPFGRLAKAKQYTVTVTGSPPEPDWDAAVYAEASYEYDVADRLERMVGPDGAETTIGYDALGRKTSMSDPDMGAWSYGYDSTGNLVRQTDARNQRTCFYYDALNRLRGKTFLTGTDECASTDPGYGGYAVKFYYDTDASGAAVANGIGRRTGAAVYRSDGSLDNSLDWAYDGLGRMTAEGRTVDNVRYQTSYEYDALDRVAKTIFFDGEEVRNTYSAQGLPLTVASVQGTTTVPLLSDAAFNARGQATCYRYGSPVIRKTRLYYNEGGDLRLSGMTSGPPQASGDSCSNNSGTNLQNLTYTYDAVGNVETIVDHNAGSQTQTFEYDEIDRLTRGHTSGGSAGSYDESYGYADGQGGKAGNLTSKAGLTYTYNSVKPHAVRTVWGSGNNPRQVQIQAKGVADGGVWPQMTLRVNGVDRQTWTVNSASYQTYSASNVSLTGNDVLEVVYSNDAGARDLYVQYVKMDEIEWWPASHMIYDKGSGAATFDGLDVIPGQEAMHWNGALRFVGGVSAFAAGYDANGNMTHRVRYGEGAAALTYDAENRLTEVKRGSWVDAVFAYDADGSRVRSSLGAYDSAPVTVYLGRHLEMNSVYRESMDDGQVQGWTAASGTWAVQSGAYRQSSTASNTNTYRAQAQTHSMVVRWKATYTSGTNAGIYLWASSSSGAERGNSYRIWQDATTVRIFENANNVATQRASFAASNAAGQTHSYVARYSPINGAIQVWRDGVLLGGWTDTTPLTSGAFLSLRTDSSTVSFDDIEVYQVKKHYYAGDRRIAMRDNGVPYYLFPDHLGSTNVSYRPDNSATVVQRYFPWGMVRPTGPNALPTSYAYTGQRLDETIGLMYYGARFYDGALGRFISPDTIVPEPGNPQALNRYSYVLNNPLRYNDPSGHDWGDTVDFLLGFGAQWASANAWMAPQAQEALSVQPNESLPMTVGRHLGNVAAIMQGVAEVGAGASADVGGGGLCLTGVGCLAGAPAVVAGTALAAHGATVAVAGAAMEGQMLGNLLMASGSGNRGAMLGQHGPQFSSKTVWQGGNARLDVENPAPGRRSGQIHLQESGVKGHKWYYNPETGTFMPEKGTGILPPGWVERLLKDKDFLAAIEKALKYLGESQ
ncbi:MAG: RHS repeat-associated core domain-containing protein [Anaerolineae bacterium]